MSPAERDDLIEAVASAWRPRTAYRGIEAHPAWHDLDEAGRREAHEVATLERIWEAALDEEGLSATGRAVLARISGR